MVVQHGPLRIGVIHGHQVVPLGDAEMLGATARKLDVDVLISGGTHRCAIVALHSPSRTMRTARHAAAVRCGAGSGAPADEGPLPPRRFEAFEAQGRFFLNPGSATGAFSPLWTPAPVPAAPAPGAAGGAAAAAGGEAAAQGEEGSKKEAVEGAKDGKACGGDGDAVKEDEQEEEDEEEEGPTPSFALLDIQGNVVVTCVSPLVWPPSPLPLAGGERVADRSVLGTALHGVAGTCTRRSAATSVSRSSSFGGRGFDGRR